MTTGHKTASFVDMGYEKAWEEIERMSNRISAFDVQGIQVEVGSHPELGRIIFILSPLGSTMMLDVESLCK